MMNDQEYKNLLEYCYKEYIERTFAQFEIQESDSDFKRDLENSLRPSAIIKSLDLIDYIKNHMSDYSEVYKYFTPDALQSTVENVRGGIATAKLVGEKSGFLTLLDRHGIQLLEGLNSSHYPIEIEKKLLSHIDKKMMDPKPQLDALTSIIKYREQAIISDQPVISPYPPKLHREKLLEIDNQLNNVKRQFWEDANKPNTKLDNIPTIEWFRDLGQIGQGSAFLTANIAFAIGFLDCETISDTDKHKSIASAVLGYGLILQGSCGLQRVGVTRLESRTR